MRATIILSIIGGASSSVVASASSGHVRAETKTKRVYKKREQFERALSGSGDIDFDDDFWAYDEGSMDVVWDDYSIEPKSCMI